MKDRDSLRDDQGPLSHLERARLCIAHLKLGDPRDLELALDRAVVVSASTLGVARVGIWIFNEERDAITLLRVTDDTGYDSVFSPNPTEISLSEHVAYATAIEHHRVLAVSDALNDPRTRDLRASYLEPRHIRSMLDAPIFLGGRVCGVLCHEHVGSIRTFSQRETDFAISVADMLSALFEQSARLALEKQLHVRDVASMRDDKVATLVRLGAGVAHDFNTILQTILLLAQQLLQRDDANRPLAQPIIDECRMGSRIVRQLMEFARSASKGLEEVELDVVLRAMEGSLLNAVGAGFELRMNRLDPSVVAADRAQIEQVVMNLVANARDAMPDGGVIDVRLTREAPFTRLSVTDHGTGMPEDVRRRAFEPFFTTKHEAGGTGLGLATVAAIVERWGGHVEVQSSPGHGTTMHVLVPLLDAPPD